MSFMGASFLSGKGAPVLFGGQPRQCESSVRFLPSSMRLARPSDVRISTPRMLMSLGAAWPCPPSSCLGVTVSGLVGSTRATEARHSCPWLSLTTMMTSSQLSRLLLTIVNEERLGRCVSFAPNSPVSFTPREQVTPTVAMDSSSHPPTMKALYLKKRSCCRKSWTISFAMDRAFNTALADSAWSRLPTAPCGCSLGRGAAREADITRGFVVDDARGRFVDDGVPLGGGCGWLAPSLIRSPV